MVTASKPVACFLKVASEIELSVAFSLDGSNVKASSPSQCASAVLLRRRTEPYRQSFSAPNDFEVP